MKAQRSSYLFFNPGFSLLELMIVVAIIGILSVIAIPSYQQYIKQARFSEVITATEPFKMAISLAIQEGSALSELTNGTHGIPVEAVATKNLEGVIVKNGIITATATEVAGDATLILKPNKDGSHWAMSGTCLNEGLCRA